MRNCLTLAYSSQTELFWSKKVTFPREEANTRVRNIPLNSQLSQSSFWNLFSKEPGKDEKSLLMIQIALKHTLHLQTREDFSQHAQQWQTLEGAVTGIFHWAGSPEHFPHSTNWKNSQDWLHWLNIFFRTTVSVTSSREMCWKKRQVAWLQCKN